MSVLEEYDRWHERVFAANPNHSDESSPWYKLVLEYLTPIADRRILEVGCGRGGFANQLAAQGAFVCGVDFSTVALNVARSKVSKDLAGKGRTDFVQADAQQLPFDDGVFDVVISCEIIEHLPNPIIAIREMARVCRDGGSLYLTTPNYFNLIGLYEVYSALVKKRARSEFAQPLDRHAVFIQTRNLVGKAGWEIVASDGTVHQVLVPRRNPITLKWTEIPAIRRWLRPFALHYFILARKRAVTR